MGGVLGLAPVLALNVAGGLVEALGWRSVFWFTPVLGAVVLGGRRPRPRRAAARRTPTATSTSPGAALAAVALFSLLVAVSRGEAWGWSSAGVAISALVGAGALVLFLVHESRAASPMIDLRLVRRRSLATANLAAMASSAALFGVLILLPFYLTAVTGFSPVRARAGRSRRSPGRSCWWPRSRAAR